MAYAEQPGDPAQWQEQSQSRGCAGEGPGARVGLDLRSDQGRWAGTLALPDSKGSVFCSALVKSGWNG